MASIQKRPNGRWRARYRDGAGKEHARHFDRKVDAQRWLDEITADVLTGRYVDPRAGNLTFEEWWRQWSALQVWTTGTRKSAEQARACVTFADERMRDIGPEHVQAWIRTLIQRDLRASTIKVRFNYVRMAFTAAVKRRVVAADPTDDVKLPRTERADVAMRIPTPEQVAAALEVSPAHFKAFIAVCAFSGLRLGEAAGLQLGDVKIRRLEVRRQVQGATVKEIEIVPPKAGSARDVPVPDDLVELLARHSNEVGVRGEEQWLLTNGPDLWTRAAAGSAWRRVRAQVPAMEAFTLHDLRHFYASALIAAGCDVVTVQRALGHSSASITLDVYSHLWSTGEERTREAATGLMRTVLGAPADPVRTEGV